MSAFSKRRVAPEPLSISSQLVRVIAEELPNTISDNSMPLKEFKNVDEAVIILSRDRRNIAEGAQNGVPMS